MSKTLNPETGRMVNPNSARQLNKSNAWESFRDKVASFVTAKDLDGLESFWADATTQARIDQWPKNWQELASCEYESAQEDLLNAGRP